MLISMRRLAALAAMIFTARRLSSMNLADQLKNLFDKRKLSHFYIYVYFISYRLSRIVNTFRKNFRTNNLFTFATKIEDN